MQRRYFQYGITVAFAAVALAALTVPARPTGAPSMSAARAQGRTSRQDSPGQGTPTATATPCMGWSVVASSNHGSEPSQLYGVDALASNDAWAVGTYQDTTSLYAQTLVEHWNGSAWSLSASPNPGLHNNWLNSVTAAGPNDVWAAGWYQNTNITQVLIEHWDGVQWTALPLTNPFPGSNPLLGIKAIAANDVWAVGQACDRPLCTVRVAMTMHWDGNSWLGVPSANATLFENTLYGVAGTAANDVWAVGEACLDAGCGTSVPLVERWDGMAWSVAALPNLGAGRHLLNAVSARAANDVWAVGQTCSDAGCAQWQSLALHWNGSAWSAVPSPNLGTQDTHLNAVVALSASDAWAAGSYTTNGSTYGNAMLHWNGAFWSSVLVSNPGSIDNDLRGLAAVSASDVWAVGDKDAGSGEQTQTQRYSGSCGAGTPTVTATATATRTSTAPAGTATATATRTPTALPGTETVTSTATATATATRTATATAGTATATPTACTMSFADVPPTAYFYEDVRCVYCRGAISGYADGTFRPFNNTTRGQLAKIVVLGFALPIVTPGPSQTPTFSDVARGSTFFDYIETAASGGIVSGYADGTYRPNTNVTRGQLAKIVVVAAMQVNGWTLLNPPTATYSDVPVGSAFYRYVETAACHGVVSGYSDGTYRPGNNATRAQIAKIVCRAVENPPVCTGTPTPVR